MRIRQITRRLAEHRDLARQERVFARALSSASTAAARQELLVLRAR